MGKIAMRSMVPVSPIRKAINALIAIDSGDALHTILQANRVEDSSTYQLKGTSLQFTLDENGDIETITVDKEDLKGHKAYLELTRYLANPQTEVRLAV